MKLKELFEAKERSILSLMGKVEDPYWGDFLINNTKLTSLLGAPGEVHGDFYCTINELTSLKHAPQVVHGDFYCSRNKLASLEGSPPTIDRNLSCAACELKSLKGIHKQIKYIGGYANFEQNPIKSHVLGLLKIQGLQRIYLDHPIVEKIINGFLGGDRDIFACQEALIEAGFPEYAQL